MNIKLLKLFSAAGAAILMGGCSTPMTTRTHDENTCMVGEKTSANLVLIFTATADNGQKYSTACNEGRTAAQTTYIGQDKQGNLHPVGAAFALQFHDIIQDKIKTTTDEAQKYYTDVHHFFGFYLQKIGGLTLQDIRKYMEDLDAKNTTNVPQPEASKAPEPVKILPNCKGNGIIRSCVSLEQK